MAETSGCCSASARPDEVIQLALNHPGWPNLAASECPPISAWQCSARSGMPRRAIAALQLNAGYWKWTPNLVSVRQISLQVLEVRLGMPNRNVDGMPKMAPSSRQAPESDKLRTVHASSAFFPRIIVPDLSVLRRGDFRWWLAMGSLQYRQLCGLFRPSQRARKQRRMTLPLLPKAYNFLFDCRRSRQTLFSASRGPSDVA